jgi:7-cyano-7-deazaguanine synthase
MSEQETQPFQKARVVVLLSSGLDSTYNLFRAAQIDDIALAITFDYGQKAAPKEIARSSALCQKLGIPHQVISLPWFSQFQSSSLINKDSEIPTGSQVQMDDFRISQKSAKSVWVPNRNGIFLNVAAGFAEALGAQFVIPGFNLEEAQTFPDNSKNFMSSLDHAFSFSTANHVRVKCYSYELDKTQIVKEALHLGIVFEDLWPCYHNLEHWCGQCESCQRFFRALKNNSVEVNNR